MREKHLGTFRSWGMFYGISTAFLDPGRRSTKRETRKKSEFLFFRIMQIYPIFSHSGSFSLEREDVF